MAVNILGSGVSPVAGARTLTTISDVNYTFANGLTESSNNVKLGGSLTGATSLNMAGYAFTITAGSSIGLAYAADYKAQFTARSIVDQAYWAADNGVADIHAGNISEASVTQHEGAIDITALTGYDANEHVDHTAVSITVAGTANEISSSAGAQTIAASRTWTIGIADNAVMPGTDAMVVPVGTTAQRSTTTSGALRYNSTTGYLEAYYGGGWKSMLHQTGNFHDTFGDYVPNEHIDWTSASSNLTTSGIITSTNYIKTDTIAENSAGNGVEIDSVSLKDGGITLAGGSATVGRLANSVDTLDDTDDTEIPTSKAIGDYVATELAAATNSGILVARQALDYSTDSGVSKTIVSLNADDVVWDIKVYVETDFDSGTHEAFQVGKTGNDSYFAVTTVDLTSIGWDAIVWANDPTDEAPMTGATDITCEWTSVGTAPTQGKAYVYVWYSQI